MRKMITVLYLLGMLLCGQMCMAETVDSLTYAVFSYLPDCTYYQEIIEARWAELEPDIRLIRAEWNCYQDGKPEGIDVIMYDAVVQDKLIREGWIQSISPDAVREAQDIFPFALEGLTVQDRLYGIPVFLCGNFLIYDRDSPKMAGAEHITDFDAESEILVINSEAPITRSQYAIEITADMLGTANPPADERAETVLSLMDQLAVKAHRKDRNRQVAMAYDAGIGEGYIGFSESMRLLQNQGDRTEIRAISFSDRENVFRLYTDAAAVTAGVHGRRLEKKPETDECHGRGGYPPETVHPGWTASVSPSFQKTAVSGTERTFSALCTAGGTGGE